MSRQSLVQSLDDVGFGTGTAARGSDTLWRRTWRAVFKIFSGDGRTRSRRRRPAREDHSVAAKSPAAAASSAAAESSAAADRPVVAERPVADDSPVKSTALEHTMETGTSEFTGPAGVTEQTAIISVGEPSRPPATPSLPPTDGNPLRRYCESILYSLRKSAGDEEQMPRVIGVTSCYAGEGVTTLAWQLAEAAAAGGQRVLLADANFESPALHKIFRRDLSPGLIDSFRGGSSLEQAVHTLPGSGLSYATAGRAAHGSQAGYVEGIRQLAQFAAQQYDLTVLDLPPLDRPAETLPLCGPLDGVLLLVEAERVRWPVAERFVGSLTRSGAKPLGVVMNKQRRHVPQWLYRTL